MKVLSSILTFPAVGWWCYAAQASEVVFELHERSQKMTDRNRYRIGGSNNSILLTVPLLHGRDQAGAINKVRVLNDGRWQVQHWRTLVSVYNRSPYFFHYESTLKALFDTEYEMLYELNMAAIGWVKQQLKLDFKEGFTAGYARDAEPGVTDLRGLKKLPVPDGRYYQVFEDRIGFVPGLSILDLLFSEGPASAEWLRRQVIKG